MPGEHISTWTAVITIGSAIGATILLMLGFRKQNYNKGHTTESRVATLEKELDDHKMNVAENYVSRPTINAIVNGIERSMEEGFKRHTAEMKLIIAHEEGSSKKRNKGPLDRVASAILAMNGQLGELKGDIKSIKEERGKK